MTDLPGVPRPGTIFADRCRIVEVLGVGGMGVVLAAEHLHLAKRVAVKVLQPQYTRDPEVVERFLREGRAAAKIEGEHVVRMLDVGKLDTGEPYMIMEYLDGESLGARIERRAASSIAESVDVVMEVCAALAEAHARGIVHRDMKPSNVFLVKAPGGGESAKVLDFGISKLLEQEDMALTKTTDVFGSPAYMSPEQHAAAKHVDTRTDIWALGVMLYELVAGVRPFTGASVAEVGAKVLTHTPPPVRALRKDAPEKLSSAIGTCLVRDASMRCATVAELARAIAPFGTVRARRALERVESFAAALPRAGAGAVADASATNVPTIASGPPPDMPRPRRRLVPLVALVAVAGAIAGLVAVASRTRTPALAPPASAAIVTSATGAPSASEPPAASEPSFASDVPTGPSSADMPLPSQIVLPLLAPGHRAHKPTPRASASASAAPSSDRFR